MEQTKLTPIVRLAEAVLDGDIGALARAITLVENHQPGSDELLSMLRPKAEGGAIIGITGPPGAGKSTLVDALIKEVRQTGRKVMVLAVDPSSPITGGALLGDRTRMGSHSVDSGVFIRSLSSRGYLGGLSEATFDVIDLVNSAGWDMTIIETVGAGQSETDLAAVADIKLLVLPPGLGDEVQAIKAGILEIADILVVNKADREGADQLVRQLQGMLDLRPEDEQRVEILKTIATEGEGVAELLMAIEGCVSSSEEGDLRKRQIARTRAALAGLTADLVRRRIDDETDPALEGVLTDIVDGRVTLRAGARRALGCLKEDS